jgi:hypothetical protein
MFTDFRDAFQQNAHLLLAGQTQVYLAKVDRKLLWETYLGAFPAELQQLNNCNCCRHFIKDYAAIVVLRNNQRYTLWDFEAPAEYGPVAAAMHELVSQAPIADAFIPLARELGTETNIGTGEKYPTRYFHHYLRLPASLVQSVTGDSLATRQAKQRDDKAVFERSLVEISLDATETVLELIAQNSLYKGEENLGMLTAFSELQKRYARLTPVEKEAFSWRESRQAGGAVSRIRNAALGTLLTDISEGKELDRAVRSFENIVAPANYKRPTALVTAKMVEDAEKTINDLGIGSALGRRFARPDDVDLTHVLYVDRSRKEATILDMLKQDGPVNPRSLSKVDDIALQDFLTKVLPYSTEVELLLENQHEPNLVSLVTAADPSAPLIFFWDNPFSWSYNNALTDSNLKQNVKAAGGNVEGVLRFSIQWNEEGQSICDLDAHAQEPGPRGSHIHFREYKGTKTAMSGMLDVDMIRPAGTGVENIIWTERNRMAVGAYRLSIHNYDSGRTAGFRAEVEFDGQTYDFNYTQHFTGTIQVATVYYDGQFFRLETELTATTNVLSKEVWGLKTNTFQKVKAILPSPNYWGEQGKGNKHFFFMLEGARNTGLVRGFFNEYLKPELAKHGKVFETLAGKLRVAPSAEEFSGLGFSTTQRNAFYVRVSGKFKRILKVVI